MKPVETISNYLQNIQKKLFPQLEEVLGPLSKKHRKLINILELVQIESFVKVNVGFRGRPENDRQILARSFVAKAVYNMPSTKAFREYLLADSRLRQICGWNSRHQVPSEPTFSRVFSVFSQNRLAERVHEMLILESMRNRLIGHISRDSTAIEGREKSSKSNVVSKMKKKTHKRGRPKKGETRKKEPTRLEKQVDMSLDDMLNDLPLTCNIGNKTDSKGYKRSWIGYKLHLDVADGDIPISGILTSASLHDSQVAVPLAEMSHKRVVNLYDLMDAAYDSPIIKDHSRKLNHVPIIDTNPRRRKQLEIDIKQESKNEKMLHIHNPEKTRYNQRSSVERVNGRLKDEFGARNIRVKGNLKVMAHLMFGILALTADQLIRFVT